MALPNSSGRFATLQNILLKYTPIADEVIEVIPNSDLWNLKLFLNGEYYKNLIKDKYTKEYFSWYNTVCISRFDPIFLFETDIYAPACGLTEIPDCLSVNTKINNAVFSNNSIKVLPNSLFTLTNITSLFLFGNLLEFINPEIGKLVNLDQLSLGHNRIKNLPSSLKECNKLRILFLNNNKFEKVPEVICELKLLEKLVISSNFLTFAERMDQTHPRFAKNSDEIPDFSENCNLKHLDLSWNDLNVFRLETIFKKRECVSKIRELKLSPQLN